jgi:16S rRNA (cytidine1402-2'-O)-methyltransferase
MGTLYMVPTPVGNLKDMTFRAIEVLQQVQTVLAEDTRVTGNLLKHYSIATKLFALHQNNEHRMVERVVERLLQGEDMAMVTDAGTPGISDPGFLLVREAVKHGVPVITLPGAMPSSLRWSTPACRATSSSSRDFFRRRRGVPRA